MRHQGSLGTAQSILRKAASKKESVGESYRGFMSEVKDELEVREHATRSNSENNERRVLYGRTVKLHSMFQTFKKKCLVFGVTVRCRRVSSAGIRPNASRHAQGFT